MPVRIRNAPLPVSVRLLARGCLRCIYRKVYRSCSLALYESKYDERVRKCWAAVRTDRLARAIEEEVARERALRKIGRSNPDWADHLAITIESLRFLTECDN